MSKAELGTKRLCASCGARFYDLLKTPIVCPKCASVLVPPTPARPSGLPRPASGRPEAALAAVPGASDSADLEAQADEEAEEGVGADERADDGGLVVLDDEDEVDDVGRAFGGGREKRRES